MGADQGRSAAILKPRVRILHRFLVALARLAVRSGRSRDLEIIVLRHQLMVLRRQHHRPQLNDGDRTLLGAIAAALPRPRRTARIDIRDNRWAEPQDESGAVIAYRRNVASIGAGSVPALTISESGPIRVVGAILPSGDLEDLCDYIGYTWIFSYESASGGRACSSTSSASS